MGISIYYSAYRDRPMDDDERASVEAIASEQNDRLLASLAEQLPGWKATGVVPDSLSEPGELCEGVDLFLNSSPDDPKELFTGSSKISHSACGMEVMDLQAGFFMQSALPALRQALPDAEWQVHLDDFDLPWDAEHGEYTYPSAP